MYPEKATEDNAKSLFFFSDFNKIIDPELQASQTLNLRVKESG